MESNLSNLIYDIKEKITDAEYKNLMETLKTSYEEKEENDYVLYDITYLKPTIELKGTNADLSLETYNIIIKLNKKKTSMLYTSEDFLEDMEDNNGIINTDYRFKNIPYIKTKEYVIGGSNSCTDCYERYNEEMQEWCSDNDGDIDTRPCSPHSNTFELRTENKKIVVLKWKKV